MRYGAAAKVDRRLILLGVYRISPRLPSPRGQIDIGWSAMNPSGPHPIPFECPVFLIARHFL
jgi:hypothetical protein